MKKNNLLILLILNIFIFSGCQNTNDMDDWERETHFITDFLYSKNAKLKQVSGKSENGWFIYDYYEYDDSERISKVSHHNSYSLYVYNDKNLLDKIIYHDNYLDLSVMTYIYSYDNDGHKLKVVMEYRPLDQALNQTDSTLYFYENNHLKRENNYDGRGNVMNYIEYEYDNQGKLVEETYYLGKDNTIYQISKHVWQNGVDIKTEIFSIYLSEEYKIREIRRFYDKNENLIYLKSEELSPFSSVGSGVTKYEYY